MTASTKPPDLRFRLAARSRASVTRTRQHPAQPTCGAATDRSFGTGLEKHALHLVTLTFPRWGLQDSCDCNWLTIQP